MKPVPRPLRPSGPGPRHLPVLGASGLALALLLLELLAPSTGWSTAARIGALGLLPVGVVLWRRRPPGAEYALAAIGLVIVRVIVGASGGSASSPAYPLVLLYIAAVAALLSTRPALAAVLATALAETAEHVLYGAPTLPVLVTHAGFLGVFGALSGALLALEVRALRRAQHEELERARERLEVDARDFRLIGSSLRPAPQASGPPAGDTDRSLARRVGSVRVIRESLVDVLDVARLAVGADTAMLFTLNDAGTTLKLKECVALGAELSIIEKPIPASEGALGAVVKTRRSVNLRPREGGRGLGYRSRAEIGSFLGVPVLEDGHVRGVLAVDRAANEAFTEAHEELLEAVAREAQRAMESERIFVAMDRTKYEHERLYEAFALLNEALTVEAFAARLLDAAARILRSDLSSVTLFDEPKQEHTIACVRSDVDSVRSALEGARFRHDDGGLVAMALKNGHALPYVPLSEQPDRARLVLFGALDHPELQSVKVFPLLERGAALGALVLGWRSPGKEPAREEERMFEVLAAHAAITLANARMYERMETMATTDGLTGAVNHRRFKELLGEALARATRFNRKVSVLMVDADHFKSVNDTYGHPVGDLVLKRIASILQGEARRTDVVARYGGEEFVVVLDETDTDGAAMVAERMRERIEREVIQGDFGRVRVTASLGVATWPDHGRAVEELMEGADQALYEAKRKGRNRVVVCRGAHCAPPDRAAIPTEEAAPPTRVSR